MYITVVLYLLDCNLPFVNADDEFTVHNMAKHHNGHLLDKSRTKPYWFQPSMGAIYRMHGCILNTEKAFFHSKLKGDLLISRHY